MNILITKKAFRNELVKALSKHKSYKLFVSELKNKLEEFIHSEVYTTAFKFTLYTGFSLNISYRYNDEECNFKLDIKNFSAEITILTTSYKAIDVSVSKIINIIADIATNTVSTEDLRYTGVFQKLELQDKFPMYVNKLIAWSSGSVGVYHVEQESGEGWIIVPKEPKDNNFKGLYNFK